MRVAQCEPTMLWLGQAALSAGYAKSLTSEVVHDVPDERPLCERVGLPPVRRLLRHEVEHKQPVRRDQREVVGDVLFGPRFVQKLPALQCVPSSAVQGRPVQSRAVQCAALLIDRMHCCAMHTCTTQTAAGSAARSDSYCVMPAVLRYAVSLDAGSCSSGDAAVRQGGACSAARKSAADHCPCVRWMHHFVELVNGVVRVGAVLAGLRLDEPPAELDVPAIGAQRCPTHGIPGEAWPHSDAFKARQGKAVPRERTPTCALSMRHYRYE